MTSNNTHLVRNKLLYPFPEKLNRLCSLLQAFIKEIVMPPINILVLVHGMVPDKQPRDPLITPEEPQGILEKLFDDRKIVIYQKFWEKL
jgi:hypothetical protein